MNKIRIVVFLLLTGLRGFSQGGCEAGFVRDTLFVPKEEKVVNGEYVETTLKDLSVVRFFRSDNNKFYLKFAVTKNLYFEKVGVLEIQTGSKSYYAKDTKQFKIDKHTGMFVIEIFKNYMETLKNDGITAIVFNDAVTDFTRQDASNIRKTARCFYDAAFSKQ